MWHVILLGELSLWIALLLSVWSVAAFAIARMLNRVDLEESGRRAVMAAFLLLLFAAGGLVTALVTHDFTRTYVAAHTSSNTPMVYTVAALWAGWGGWLLLVAIALCGLTVFAVSSTADVAARPSPHAAMVALPMLAAVGVVCLSIRPFAQSDYAVTDGRGLEPVLQTIGFVLVPPIDALALSLVVVLVAVHWHSPRCSETERWSRLAIVGLALSVITRAWWTYTVLEGGRFWNWGIGEGAILGAWFLTVGLPHRVSPSSATEAPSPILTRLLLLGATLGIVFGGPLTINDASGIDILSRTTFAAALLIIGLIAWIGFSGPTSPRHSSGTSRGAGAGVSRPSPHDIGALTSVIVAALITTLTIVPFVEAWVHGATKTSTATTDTVLAIAAPVLLATFAAAPFASGAVAPRRWMRVLSKALVIAAIAALALIVSGTTSWFALLTAVLGSVALVMIARDIVVSEDAKYRALVHAGLVCVVIGLSLASRSTSREATLRPGESVDTRDPMGHAWRFVGQGVSLYDVVNSHVIAVTVDALREGVARGVVKTEKRQIVDVRGDTLGPPRTGVGLLRSALLDTRLELVDVNGEIARVRIDFVPFASLVWLGAALALVGCLARLLGREHQP